MVTFPECSNGGKVDLADDFVFEYGLCRPVNTLLAAARVWAAAHDFEITMLVPQAAAASNEEEEKMQKDKWKALQKKNEVFVQGVGSQPTLFKIPLGSYRVHTKNLFRTQTP